MSKICTDINQSKKLLELRVDVDTADMRIGNYVGKSGKVDGTNVHYYTKGESFGAPEIIPAWSLSALLNILSTIIDYSYEFVFLKQTTDGRGDRLKNVYRCSVDMKDIWNIEPLDAAFEMVVWLKENWKI